MTMIPRQETAKIYRFPVKERAQAQSRREASTRAAKASPISASEFGSGWYHEAAMEDCHKGRKH